MRLFVENFKTFKISLSHILARSNQKRDIGHKVKKLTQNSEVNK